VTGASYKDASFLWRRTSASGRTAMDQKKAGPKITIFFCQQIDANQDVNRRPFEEEFGPRIRFFPLPCSGRIEPLHLMRALEAGADKVYLVTCPEGACRYREGNTRAKKRLSYVQGLIEEIGLEKDRLEVIQLAGGTTTKIDKLAGEILAREGIAGRPAAVRGGKRRSAISHTPGERG
jgi:F420-non-reducing hydrogenase iron-sulfur subunit